MSYAHNTTQNIIYFLAHRAQLDIPDYILRITPGDKGGCYDIITKELMIPKWIFGIDCYERPDDTYCIYYIAHELAHACVGDQELHSHGSLFYMYFRELCPNDLKHWEIDYLPENEALVYV